jgi:hypothetical protein
MTPHISDDLPALLTGEATRDETLAAAAHLRTCADCQQELVSAVIAHASLASARRFAPDVIRSAGGTAEATPALPELPELPQFPELGDVVGTRRRRTLALAAAAVVVLGGAGVTLAETVGSGGSSSGTTVVLDAFDIGTHTAKATVGDTGSMRIDASALPKLDREHVYEVWLTNAARTRLQAVGSISNDNRAQLTVSPKVMSQYSAIEVSIQGVLQTAYSGTSVLRGTYG